MELYYLFGFNVFWDKRIMFMCIYMYVLSVLNYCFILMKVIYFVMYLFLYFDSSGLIDIF